ncbi:hypothetical protein K504DRAFT_497261 [Pleomassaria siparia CBS 279.74]|uniref:Ubiquitin 3 binding protein But2 C-terminal domain-containing protein n=1 Tax=Pleomassaria siparia CBS 279.74 TaxID=1314801 RepID=A0A6G1KST7_9PLEO|nr:hypothetical protein K504DRAFT_497261 [Pleomassaria siparia CBS 279.74]
MIFRTTIHSFLVLASTLSAFPLGPTTNYPDTTSIYNSLTREVTYDVAKGALYRVHGHPADLSTLVTFYFHANGPQVGKTCEFKFELEPNHKFVGKDQLLHVCESKTNVTKSTVLPQMLSNYQGRHLGMLRAVSGGQAVPKSGLEADVKWSRFPCPEPSESEPVLAMSFEVAPVEVDTDFEWEKTHGPWIQYLDPIPPAAEAEKCGLWYTFQQALSQRSFRPMMQFSITSCIAVAVDTNVFHDVYRSEMTSILSSRSTLYHSPLETLYSPSVTTCRAIASSAKDPPSMSESVTTDLKEKKRVLKRPTPEDMEYKKVRSEEGKNKWLEIPDLDFGA